MSNAKEQLTRNSLTDENEKSVDEKSTPSLSIQSFLSNMP